MRAEHPGWLEALDADYRAGNGYTGVWSVDKHKADVAVIDLIP
jgi:hypothetical protein